MSMMLMGIFWSIPPTLLGLLVAHMAGWRPNWSRPQPFRRERERSPLDILKERYARGEIRQEEYVQMQRDLEI